jgi:hypothetical protein
MAPQRAGRLSDALSVSNLLRHLDGRFRLNIDRRIASELSTFGAGGSYFSPNSPTHSLPGAGASHAVF